MLKSVDCGSCVLCVVCANGNSVKLFVIDHFLVRRIESNAFNTESLHEFFSLAGDEVSCRNNFNIVLELVALNVGFSDPTCTDDTYLELFAGVFGFFFNNGLFELTENCV